MQNLQNYDFIVKVLIIGDSQVGKSNILLRYCDNKFQYDTITTIGVDSRIKIIRVNETESVKLIMWDTAGQERFRSITKNTYKGTQGFVLVYDVTNYKSFQNIQSWMDSISENIQLNDVCISLVGNKTDLIDQRQVSLQEGQALATKYNTQFYETSAKDNILVANVFEDIATRIRSKLREDDIQQVMNKLKVEKTKKTTCCR